MRNYKKWEVVKYLHFFYLSFANNILNRIPSYRFRRYCYKYIYGMRIGKNSHIQMGVRIYSPWNIIIGDNCAIGHNCLLDGRRGIVIGHSVDISGYVKILTLGHDLDDPDYQTKGARVTINSYCSVFTSSSILPGVTLAEGSVIGLGSVITRDTKPWAIYAGIPAKFIRYRDIKRVTYKRNYRRYFH